MVKSFSLGLGNLETSDKIDLNCVEEFLGQDLDECFGKFVSELPVLCPEICSFELTMNSLMS